MATPRPRRAMRPSPVARLTRIGAPTLVAALLVTGVAVAASPSAQQEVLAEPAAQTSTAADTSTRDAQADRVNRSTTRDALSPGELAARADAVEKAAKEAKATKAAAAKKAAKAKKDAADKKAAAAEKKAAAKAAAEEKAAAAEKKAAAAEVAAAKKATDAKAVASVSGSRYTTVALNIRTRAASSAAVRTVLASSAKVSVTSVKDGEWQQVVNDDQAGWVLAKYLVTKKPVAEKAAAKSSDSSSSSSDSKSDSKADSSSNGSNSSGGLSGSACSSSSVESGLTADAIRVHRAICAKFPQVKAYGGVRADSLPEHPSGRALDAMISDSAVGWEIANWVRANRVQLGVSQILYSQKIWTVQRGSEGWRSFSDRGSVSANHYDHVHITVYGSSGTS